MIAAIVAGLVAGLAVAMPVGPIALLLIGLSARTGLRVGAAAALGVATVDGVYAAAAVLGGAALAGLIAPISVPLRWVAAAVLVALSARTAWLALRTHRSPTTAGPGPAKRPSTWDNPVTAYLALVGLTLLNPATIVSFAALALARQAAHPMPGAALTLFVVGAFVGSAGWQLLLAGGGSLLGTVLSGRTGRLATAMASSLVMTALAVLLLV